MRRFAIGCAPFLAVLVASFLAGAPAYAGEGFDACAAAFPGDDVERAPKRANPTPSTTADSVALCYHQSGTPFFALDYSVKRLTANWVAHKLENSFGDNGCRSVARGGTSWTTVRAGIIRPPHQHVVLAEAEWRDLGP